MKGSRSCKMLNYINLNLPYKEEIKKYFFFTTLTFHVSSTRSSGLNVTPENRRAYWSCEKVTIFNWHLGLRDSYWHHRRIWFIRNASRSNWQRWLRISYWQQETPAQRSQGRKTNKEEEIKKLAFRLDQIKNKKIRFLSHKKLEKCLHDKLSTEWFKNQSWTHNLGQKIGDKFIKLSKKGFSMECVTADFFTIFYQDTSNFGFRVDGWVLAIKPKHFRDFLEIS